MFAGARPKQRQPANRSLVQAGCILRQLLGKIDTPHHAGQARDEPGPFDAKGRLYCLMSFRLVRLACGHTAFSAKAAGETSRLARRSSVTNQPSEGKRACRAEAR